MSIFAPAPVATNATPMPSLFADKLLADNRLIAWDSLEKKRLGKLGIPHRYSRYFVTREHPNKLSQEKGDFVDKMTASGNAVHAVLDQKDASLKHPLSRSRNTLTPFMTNMKTTCGLFFERGQNHGHLDFGIPAADLVKWRSSY